jgi:transposase-like protein
MMVENKQNKKYSDELKAEAVRLHLEEGLSPYRIIAMFETLGKKIR